MAICWSICQGTWINCQRACPTLQHRYFLLPNRKQNRTRLTFQKGLCLYYQTAVQLVIYWRVVEIFFENSIVITDVFCEAFCMFPEKTLCYSYLFFLVKFVEYDLMVHDEIGGIPRLRNIYKSGLINQWSNHVLKPPEKTSSIYQL